MIKYASTSIALCAAMSLAQAATDTSDLWDTHQGTVITASSPIHSGSSARDMFGANDSGIETGNTLFFDGGGVGQLHFVEWTTTHAVTIGRFVLYATHDGPPFDAHQRGFSRFSLQAFNVNSLAFEELYSFTPDNPYSFMDQPSVLLVSAAIAPTTASSWRAEFVQFGPSSNSAGPRIVELDGFAPAPVPVPAAAWLLASGLLVPALRRRPKTPG